jgi:hypothetical protein
MDYILLDADGKIAEVTIFWRPLPSGVALQRNLADALGMQPLGTPHERGVTTKAVPYARTARSRTGRCCAGRGRERINADIARTCADTGDTRRPTP